MNIYKISRKDKADWDEFNGAVVFAKDEEEARYMYPGNLDQDENKPIKNIKEWDRDNLKWGNIDPKYDGWIDPKDVAIEFLGTTESKESRIVLVDYNAG